MDVITGTKTTPWAEPWPVTEWLYAPNQPYAQREDSELCFQLLFPYRRQWDTDERYPLLLFVPGAAWYRQEMYNSIPQYARLAERGVVVAAVQVRASTQAHFPAQVQDVLDALHHLLGQAERWHIDPQKVFLGGNSSGGHIALLTALSHARELSECPDMRLRGVVTMSAPTDMHLLGGKPSLDLLGVGSLQEDAEKVNAASCATYITPNAPIPPILLLHGTEDEVVSSIHAVRLHDCMTEAGKDTELVLMQDVNHGGAAFWCDKVLDRILTFMREKAEEPKQ